MSDLDLAIKIKLETENVDTVIKNIEKIEKYLENVDKVIKKNPEFKIDTQKAKDAIKDLENNIKGIKFITPEQTESLKKVGVAVQELSKKLYDFGKDAMEAANEAKGYENAIIRLSSSAKEGEKTIDFINKLAMSSQEFSLDSLYEAGKTITKFKLNVEETLPLISDFADAYSVGVEKAATIFSKALTGTRGGMTAIMSQFGITREELLKFGAEFTKAGVIVPQSTRTMEAAFKVLEEGAKRAATQGEDSAERFENAVTRYNNTLQITKIAIGKELLPIFTSLMEQAAEVTEEFGKLSRENKELIKDAVLVGGGITGIGYAVSVATPAVQGLTMAFRALSAAALAFPVATITIAIGAAAIAGVEYWKKLEQQKSDRIVSETKKVEGGFKNIKEAINEVNKTPMKIVIEGNIEQKLKDIEQKIRNYRDLAVANSSQTPFTIPGQGEEGEIDIATGMFTGVHIAQGEALGEVYRKVSGILDSVNNKREKGITLSKTEETAEKKALDVLAQIDVQLKETAQSQSDVIQGLKQSSTHIEDAKKSWGGLFSALDAGFNSTIDGMNKLSDASKKDADERSKIDDKSFKAKLQYYKDDYDHLQTYWKTYKLSYTQQQELTEALTQAKKKQVAEEKQILSQREQQERESYQTFKSTLDNALLAGTISQKQYYEKIGQYLTIHSEELKSNTKLKLEIDNDYLSKSRETNEKAYKEKIALIEKEKEVRTAAGQYILQIEKEQAQQQQEAIQKQRETLQALLQFNQSGETSSIFGDVEADIKKLQEAFSIQKQIVISMEQQGEALKLRLESGQTLNTAENDTLKLYLEQKRQLQEIGKQIENNANTEIAAYSSRKEALLTYVETAVNEGKISIEQADSMIKTFIEKNLRSSKNTIDQILKGGVEGLTKEGLQSLEIFNSIKKDAKEAGLSVQGINTEYETSNKLLSNMVDSTNSLTSNTDKTTDAVGRMNNSLQEANKQADNLIGKMVQVGNILAERLPGGADAPNFLSPDEALTMLPGGKAPSWTTGFGLGRQPSGNYGNMPGNTQSGHGGEVNQSTDFDALKVLKEQYQLDYYRLGADEAMNNYQKGWDNYLKQYVDTPQKQNTTVKTDNTYNVSSNQSPIGSTQGQTYPIGSTHGQTYNVPASSGGNAFNYSGAAGKTEINYNINVGGRTINASTQMKYYIQGLTSDAMKYGEIA